MNLEQILPYFKYTQRMGNGGFKGSCPMPNHNDSDPSVSIRQDVNTGKILLWCFGCQTGAPGLVGPLGLTLADLNGTPGAPGAVNTTNLTTPVTEEERRDLQDRIKCATENLQQAEDYIFARFNLSINEGERLRLGVDSKFGVPHLIVPMYDPSGKVVGMQGRRLIEGEPRWRSMSGGGWSKIGCFAWDLDGPVIICEGLSDPLAVVGWAGLPAIGIRGASNTDPQVCAEIRSWLNGREAVVIGDEGTAGVKFAQEISAGVGVPSLWLPEGVDDLADFLVAGGSISDLVGLDAESTPDSVEVPQQSQQDQDQGLVRRIQANLTGVIYDDELMGELSEIPEGRLATVFAAVISEAGYGQTGNTRTYINAINRTLRERARGNGNFGGGGGPHAYLPEGGAEPPEDHPAIIWNPEDQLFVTEHSVRNAMDRYADKEFYKVSGGQYVKVLGDEIVNLKEAGVKSMLSRMGHWRVINGEQERAHVPIDAVRLISDPSWDCELPEIKRRVNVPFMLQDGTIVSEPGYHEASGVFYLPMIDDPIEVPPVPATISDEDVARAKQIFEEVLDGFRFMDEASRTNLIAMTLTSPLRELFRNNPMVPLLISTAPQSGSGKGTSIRVPLSTAGVGPQSLATTTYNSDESEFEKKLVAKLLKKSTYIFLDNIRNHVSSSVMEQMLTAANYDGRTLGFSEVNSLSTLVLWVGTLQSTGSFNRDLTRRCIPVTLMKNVKGDWKHKNIEGYLADMRGEMIWACFVVARKWLQDGAPAGQVRLDGYTGWTEAIGGMIEHVLGYSGMLDNVDSFRKAQDVNAVTIDAILERWLENNGEEENPASAAGIDFEDPALHAMLGLHNPTSTRQIMTVLVRQLDAQKGHIVSNTHVWIPTGAKKHPSQGLVKHYKCVPILPDGTWEEE